MTPFYVALLIMSAVVAFVARGDLRVISWLSAAQASFWSSVLYWDLATAYPGSFPYPEAFGAFTNIMVCYALYRFGYYRWELWFCAVFVTMIGVDFLYLFGQLVPLVEIYPSVFSWTLLMLNAALVITVGLVFSFKDHGHELGGAMQPWLTVFGRLRHVQRAGSKGQKE